MRYSDKLKDPRWQKKRLEILQRDQWMCQKCGDSDSTLHVHHRNYVKDLEPWDYPNDSLITLCEDCHEDEMQSINSGIESLVCAAKMNFFSGEIVQIAIGLRFHKFYYPSEVVASIIEWGLQDESICDLMRQKYFAHLGVRRQDVAHPLSEA
jgi:hypothetical protein